MKLAGMTASVAGRYTSTRLKNLFQSAENAARARAKSHKMSGTRIAATLGELKGAVMKVGQMASIAADVLPKEVVDALQGLQKEAPPMAYSVIAEQIEAELGSAPVLLYERFDREPFASASIGQVHRARTDDGREVVVKVQYPGVDRAVDSDLRHLKLALRASGLVPLGRKALNATFEELRERLHEELDYCIEADNVRRFARFHERHDFVRIPDVVGERSAKRVLTLTFLDGDGLDELDGQGYTQEERDRLGVNLLTFMVSEIFENECIHGDPNPGNFAFHRDGTVVVYDFGCIKELPPEVVLAFRDAILLALTEDYAGVDAALFRLGRRRAKGPPVEDSYYKRWRDLLGLPFLGDQEFDFATSTLHEQVIAQIPGALKRIASFQPARDLIFLDRMIAGHYGNLCKMRASFPVLALVRPFMEAYAALPDGLPEGVGSQPEG